MSHTWPWEPWQHLYCNWCFLWQHILKCHTLGHKSHAYILVIDVFSFAPFTQPGLSHWIRLWPLFIHHAWNPRTSNNMEFPSTIQIDYGLSTSTWHHCLEHSWLTGFFFVKRFLIGVSCNWVWSHKIGMNCQSKLWFSTKNKQDPLPNPHHLLN